MSRFVNHSAIPGAPPWPTTRNSPESGPRTFTLTQEIPYYCRGGHKMTVTYDADADHIPPEQDCRRCGLPSGLDPGNPPEPPREERYHTHLEYVKERRTGEDAAQILADAVKRAAAGGFNR